MKPIKEAELILQKENLTVDDYNRFVELGKLIDGTNKEEEYEYGWLCEAFELRLPEIAHKTGNYDFVKKDFN
jgi:hypothetical protein